MRKLWISQAMANIVGARIEFPPAVESLTKKKPWSFDLAFAKLIAKLVSMESELDEVIRDKSL